MRWEVVYNLSRQIYECEVLHGILQPESIFFVNHLIMICRLETRPNISKFED